MTKKLSEYNQKRNFTKTKEPESQGDASGSKLRFVVQHHMSRKEHYDLRLEWDDIMLSWAVPKGPSYSPADKRLAIHVEDHPLEYRNFEGTIPKGEYGGGTVMIWDEGFYEPDEDITQGIRKGSLKFTLYGARLKGKWALVRLKTKDDEEKEKNNWLLIKDKDTHSQTSSGILEYTTSIRTMRTMEEIEKGAAPKKSPPSRKSNKEQIKNPFTIIEAQLAKLVYTIPKDQNWLYEIKYDGYRIISYIENDTVRLLTRNGNDYASRFTGIADSLITFAKGRAMVLDGEIAVTDTKGRTDFQALQNYFKNPKGKNLTYIVFDLLALNGNDLRALPLIKRKEKLEKLLKNAPKNIHYSRHVKDAGEESMRAAEELKMEGIIGKKADSPYTGSRNGDWIKLKCEKLKEFVIGGYTVSEKNTSGISSLLLGFYEGNNLIYAGRAGTGFTVKSAKETLAKFKSLIRKTSPFKTPPKAKAAETINWLRPAKAANIKFTEWTNDNKLRQASFKGLCENKDPKEIKFETKKATETSEEKEIKPPNEKETEITVQGIKISSPDKILYQNPEIKKLDVIHYYEQVAKLMLPHIENRILSIVRCPKGIESGTCFFKKHPEPNRKGISTITVSSDKDKERNDYFYITDIAGLISEAQMGSLEFHTWGSRTTSIEKPDIIIFDLDPDEGMDLKTIRRGVRDLRTILTGLSLNSYLKTSGHKGYHVVVPIKAAASWETIKNFSKSIAQLMEKKWPARYTSNSRKQNRSGKIYIDWLRNTSGATSIAPYSLRARPGATVSMPISWDELSKIPPDGITISKALKRIKTQNPWHDFFKNTQKLNEDDKRVKLAKYER